MFLMWRLFTSNTKDHFCTKTEVTDSTTAYVSIGYMTNIPEPFADEDHEIRLKAQKKGK